MRVLWPGVKPEPLLTFVFVASTAAAAARYFRNWPAIWDVGMWDETNALGPAIYGWYGTVRSYELQPLHMAVYKLVHGIVADPLDLFFAVALLVTLFAVAGVLAATWSLSRNMLVAGLAASAYFAANLAMYEPRAVYTATGVLGFGIALTMRRPDFMVRAAGLALTALVACFARSEFVISFYLLSLIAILAAAPRAYRFFRHPIRSFAPRPAARRLAAYVLLGVAVCLFYSFPLLSGSGRSFLAFGQNYALRYVAAHHADFDAGLNWEWVLDTEFPGARSELQALLMYPGRVIPFFIANAADLLAHFRHMAAPLLAMPRLYLIAAAAGLALAIGAAIARWLKRPLAGDAVRADGLLPDLLLLGVLVLPLLADAILIYPLDRHITVLAATLAFVLARLLRSTASITAPAAAVLAVVFAVTVQPRAPKPDRPALATVTALRSQPPIARMLEIGKGWCAYLPGPCQRFGAFSMTPYSDLLSVIETNHIDAVLLDDEFLGYARLRHEDAFLAWAAQSPLRGWSRTELGGGQILLRRDDPETAALEHP